MVMSEAVTKHVKNECKGAFMDINKSLAKELSVQLWQVEAAVKLIDEGNTIPFIARYRKEATGTLNDEVLRKLYERLNYLRNLEEKKAQVIAAIEEQGKLTAELKKQIQAAETLVVVEDLYRPFRPKRRTRAMIAREKGLEPLGKYDTPADVKTSGRGGGESLPVRRKGGTERGGGSDGRLRYPCGRDFR